MRLSAHLVLPPYLYIRIFNVTGSVALVKAAIVAAKAQGWDAIFVVGDPEYYIRFRFSSERAAGFQCRYVGDYFMVLGLSENFKPSDARVDYASAFSAFE